MRVWFSILALVIAAGPWRSGLAAEMKFVGAAPVAAMTRTDKSLFYQAAVKALDDAADGKEISWQNPASGAQGKIKLIRTDDLHGPVCRFVQVRNEANNTRSQGVFRACRNARGGWRLRPQGAAARSPRAAR